ncbi:HD domain-containing protein [Brucella anthropi]|uniref:HD domain-containing protein n=1 Tax=Brucella anthropi TaxID=529 RepID=A0A6I0DMG4_BRUAN|nr:MULTISPECIES: HD domain-containing protein [Brucella/Ochrobactrum group]MCR5939471.1 HD domain-containing protein [Ochrobactrum sp. XJ1]KAB2734254.1 HD domain-containing protein [Brucella anthropi]KAB2758042.1 HD domain-containing protein [Brucella anthropi]KAB2769555.1 HD domain-containing protein [Brucella anthropi]KAB2798903.1 HD domain-containing protein [Brucella anthropi]
MSTETEYPIDPERLSGIIQFIQNAERLKSTLRSGHTSQGRPESTAEHSWRLCLLATLFDRELGDCDRLKLIKMCIVHDLGEAISGDVPAIHQSADDGRAEREKTDLMTLCAPLPEDLRAEIMELWADYSEGKSTEAIFAKGFDKLETMMQHNIGLNPPDFDYAFNLDYGVKQTARHPLLRQFREIVDAETRRNAEKR